MKDNDNGVNVWIGFSDREQEGEWKWTDNSNSYVYKHWREGEPDGGDIENCAFMDMDDGFWKDTKCSDKHRFMCKMASDPDEDGGSTLPTTPSGDTACSGTEGAWYEDVTTGMCYQVLPSSKFSF